MIIKPVYHDVMCNHSMIQGYKFNCENDFIFFIRTINKKIWFFGKFTFF